MKYERPKIKRDAFQKWNFFHRKRQPFWGYLQGYVTLCYIESEWKKIEQVPIPLPKAASSLSEAKKMKNKFLSRWTAEIIQFIRYLIQMDRTTVWFFWVKMLTFYSYPTLLYCVMANFPLERPENSHLSAFSSNFLAPALFWTIELKADKC
jgi:hypothetical protein